MNKYKYNPINMTPFKWFCLENFPFIEEDFDSLTSYGLWCKLKEYFDKVAHNVNEMGLEVQKLSEAFSELEKYVDNYFKNLDVQDEINNKLDEMAESGKLTEIITQYIKMNALIVFDNFNEMSNSQNIVAGSNTKILGFYNKNDKGEFLFKIREPLENERYNNKTTFLLNNGLVAEVIEDNSEIKYIFPKNWVARSGDASIIIAYSKVILIDSHRASQKTELYEMLSHYGINHIDYFISSHYHDDHVGNFANLINDGYVDSNTIIYIPPLYPRLMVEGSQMMSLYYQVQNALTNAGLTARIPNENETIQIGTNFKLTFYNCSQTIYDEENYTDYNNCSIICYIEHNNNKSLYTGDCSALRRLINEEIIDTKVHLYKVEHHGINTNQNSAPIYFLRHVMPDYAVQTSFILDEKRGSFAGTSTINYLKSIGTKLYSCHQNTDYIEFITKNNLLKNMQGKENDAQANGYYEIHLYVDKNAINNTIQNGTSTHPFGDLIIASEYINRNLGGRYFIHLADGTYGNLDRNKAVFLNANVRILGNSENNTSVVLNENIDIYNSQITFKDLTLNVSNSGCISSINSKLLCENVIVNTSDNTINHSNGASFIWSTDNNEIFIRDSIVKNINTAISTHNNDNVFIYNTTFENLVNVSNINASNIKERYNTFTNCENTFIYSYGGLNIDNAGISKQKLLFSGDSIGDITLLDEITKYNMLIVTMGYVSDQGVLTSVVRSYGTSKFIKGGKYALQSFADLIRITVDSTNATLINTAHTGTGQAKIREIYGFNIT